MAWVPACMGLSQVFGHRPRYLGPQYTMLIIGVKRTLQVVDANLLIALNRNGGLEVEWYLVGGDIVRS